MVRFTNNNNHNNSNLAVDMPLDGSSCRLFRGRIVIWNVSFCGGTQRKPSKQDDNRQKFKPEDMTPDPGFRESGPNPGHSGGSQVLSPLRDSGPLF